MNTWRGLRAMRGAVLALACMFPVACAGDGPPPGAGASTTTLGGGAASLAMIQQTIFTPSCAVLGCHDALTQSEGLNLSTETSSYADLVGVASACASRILVTPGNADTSYLVDKLGNGASAPCGSVMPLGLPPLSASEQQLIVDWIAAGAPQGAFAVSASTTSTTLASSENR